MKKFFAPVILLILAVAVVAYLKLDMSDGTASFDADAYLAARSRIDSLQICLYEASESPNVQVAVRAQLDSAWTALNGMRVTPSDPKVGPGGLSESTWVWIVGGILVVILCIALLLFGIRYHEKVVTQRMEALKAESRFKEPKSGFENDPTLVPPRARPPKRSIIDDAAEYAQTHRQVAVDEVASPKVAFEDENGIPENKILTQDLDSVKPHLRPTAKERITSAMQSLSDVLRSPRGMSRDYTMKIRAQSRNMTGDPSLGAASNPMETNRFDRAFIEKSKIIQMTRRGFPASAIASQLKISQEHVEEVIKESQESGN
ncbi:MAG: hypothetical protein HUK21_06250 [Fibrobacteraceae bacterium]|nr:hypothetical protein [Fibrobacteraceae bacterium]